MDRLLSPRGIATTTDQDLVIESQLLVSSQPWLGDEKARTLQNALNEKGLQALTIDERWNLYRHWYSLHLKELGDEMDRFRKGYW